MKKILVALYVGVVLSLSLIPRTSLAEEEVLIKNALSGKSIDVKGTPGVDNEAQLQLWDCELSGKASNNTPTDQKWELITFI